MGKLGVKKINYKKGEYNGIKFDSQLEIRMYQLLEEAKIPFVYGEHTFTLLDGFIYPAAYYYRVGKQKVLSDNRTIRKMSYTPDFSDPSGEVFIIETKGRANESFPLRWKMFQQHLVNEGKSPMLFIPQSIADCKLVVEKIKEFYEISG